MTKPTCG